MKAPCSLSVYPPFKLIINLLLALASRVILGSEPHRTHGSRAFKTLSPLPQFLLGGLCYLLTVCASVFLLISCPYCIKDAYETALLSVPHQTFFFIFFAVRVLSQESR
jgi:hypothetical protein